MSRCQRYYEIISAYIDSQANALEQLALQEHLKSCSACKQELASHYALRDMVQSYKPIADINITSSVMRQIRYNKQEEAIIHPAHFTEKVGNRWIALGVMVLMTATALMLGNVDNAVYAQKPDPAKEYATFLYQHVNDEESHSISYQGSDSSFKQVSFIK
jgi:anti-sigma factor RsiW